MNQEVSMFAIAGYLLESVPNRWIEHYHPKILATERHCYSRIGREEVSIKIQRNFKQVDGFNV